MENNFLLTNNCEKFKKDDIVIYTSTFYDNSEEGNVRAKLGIKFLKNIEKLGIKGVVAEGGSTNELFLKELKKLKNITIVKSNEGMGKDRRNALERAINENPNCKYFLWSEPEKDNLITFENINNLINEAIKNNYDIIVPKRNENNNIPEFQKWIEKRANKRIYNEMNKKGIKLNEILDLWFGPKFFTKKGAEYFLKYNSKLDKWDAIIKPVITGIQEGINVGSVEINYKYDDTQSKNEGKDNKEIMKKRLEQYRTILKEILGDDITTL